MWICPVCSGKEQSKYKCTQCGFDEREDFIKYRTVCSVSAENFKKRQEQGANAIVEKRYSDGKYTGTMKNGKKDGHGIFCWDDGERYEGEWKNGDMNGQGTYYYASGNRYEGGWKNDKKEGYGVFYRSNGDRYEGEWKDGKRQ